MNVKRMEKLAKLMDSLPKGKLDMGTWFSPGRDLYEKSIICELDARNDCGTTCCIAGWTVFSAGKCYNEFGRVINPSGNPVKTKVYSRAFAQKYLQLNDAEASELFYDWGISTPQQAATKIRQMIQEG